MKFHLATFGNNSTQIEVLTLQKCLYRTGFKIKLRLARSRRAPLVALRLFRGARRAALVTMC